MVNDNTSQGGGQAPEVPDGGAVGSGETAGGEVKKSDLTKFAGSLVKAQIMIYENKEADKVKETIDFQFNPSTITVKRSAVVTEVKKHQETDEIQYVTTNPTVITLPEIIFDGYAAREDVRDKYVSKLESALYFIPDTHILPYVRFVWGDFWSPTRKGPNSFIFNITSCETKYTLFLPDGKPVRASVKLELTENVDPDGNKNSPDHAKLYTVRQGDTLQGIAYREYDDAGEWRRIAETNSIENPLDLRPGTKLLVPPILK